MAKRKEKCEKYEPFYPVMHQPAENQNFTRKDFAWNNRKDYRNTSFNRYKPLTGDVNHYRYSRGRKREIRDRFNKLNFKHSEKKELQDVTGNVTKTSCPWSDEAIEEERKRQVSDTANKLKNKLKMWNTVKSDKLHECDNSSNETSHKVVPSDMEEMSVKACEHKRNKPIERDRVDTIRHIEQSPVKVNGQQGKKSNISDEQTAKEPAKLENRGISIKANLHNSNNQSENKQKKMQQSLIGELMTIPKANLEKVLINPKLYPKIEKKMAQIVMENKLILMQKLRKLAESKINQEGQFMCSALVNDLDLTDYDLAVDLCQLPTELINQISDIFQLDLSSSMKVSNTEDTNKSDRNKNEHGNAEMEMDGNAEVGTDCNENLNSHDLNNEDKVTMCKPNELPPVETMPLISIKKEFDVPAENNYFTEYPNISVPENFQSTSNLDCTKTNPQSSPIQFYSNISNEGSINLTSSANDFSAVSLESDKLDANKYPKSGETVKSYNYKCETSDELPRIMDSCFRFTNGRKLVNETLYDTNEELGSHFVVKRNSSDEVDEINLTGSIFTNQCYHDPEKYVTNSRKDGINVRNFVSGVSTSNETVYKPRNDYFGIEGCSNRSIETQTDINLIEADHSQPFVSHFYSDNMEETLLNEVQVIDDLLHRLNQRKFIIFLKLVGLNSFNLNSNSLKTSLMQTITNSDSELLKELSLGGNKRSQIRSNFKRKKNSGSSKKGMKKSCPIKIPGY